MYMNVQEMTEEQKKQRDTFLEEIKESCSSEQLLNFLVGAVRTIESDWYTSRTRNESTVYFVDKLFDEVVKRMDSK